jgi:hypothetical protein
VRTACRQGAASAERDFEAVYELWLGYLVGKVSRREVCEVTYYSKYVISILHQFLGEAG